MKRKFCYILLSSFIVLQGCNQSEIDRLEQEIGGLTKNIDHLKIENSDLQYEVSILQDRNNALVNMTDDIDYATQDLEWELNRLSSEIDDFGWEECQTNVWDVENQLNNVMSSFEYLQSSIYFY